MDRDYIVHIINLAMSGGLRDADMLPIIHQFLLDKGKDPEMVSKFMDILRSGVIGYMLPHISNIALEHFEHKFNICKLYECNKEGVRIKKVKVF